MREVWNRLWPGPWPVLALAALVYLPSLQHVARADQIVYLAKAARMDGLWDLTVGSYAFNRTNFTGDFSLFRPVLYALLGLERWLFGYRFWLWQAVSILLHLGVVAALWGFLRTRTTAFAAALLCAYFAVQYASMELVVWHHIAGYVLFCALLTAAARCLFPGEGERVRGAAGVALLAVGAFTYELGNIAAIAAVSGMLAARWLGRREYSPGLVSSVAAIPVVYLACSIADLYHQFGTLSYLDVVRSGQGLFVSAVSMLIAGVFWSVFGFVPTLVNLRPGDRLEFRGLEPLLSGEVLAGVVLLGAFLLTAGRVLYTRIDRESLQARVPSLLFLALTMAGYCAMIVFGRANERGFIFALGNASYYAYPFNLLLVMSAGVVMGRPAPERASVPLSRWAQAAAAFALVSIAMNARGVMRTNHQLAEWGQPRAALIAGADRLERTHRGDAGFSFALDGPCPPNQPLPWYPSASGSPASLLALLFPDTYRESGGTYTLVCHAPDRQTVGAPRREPDGGGDVEPTRASFQLWWQHLGELLSNERVRRLVPADSSRGKRLEQLSRLPERQEAVDTGFDSPG